MTVQPGIIQHRIRVLDPTFENAPVGFELAAPLPGLEGRRIALLSNGKVGVSRFYDHVERMLLEQHRAAEVVRRTKRNLSAPCEAELMAELLGYDAVFSAVRD